MNELRTLARQLLESGEVQLFIGWEDGRLGARPTFITRPDEADRLIFDTRCVHNLATYLNPRRPQLTGLGKLGMVVKGCDVKAVAGLLREAQLTRDRLVIVGVRCGGVLEEPALPEAAPLAPQTVAPRCYGCDNRVPSLVDHIIGPEQPEPPAPAVTMDDRVAMIDAMSPDERWKFWTEQFSRCVRCYACRQVCPMCVCERCIADKTMPQWIETASQPRGNYAWNMVRALHLAGRCVDCGECERFCPVGIPLSLVNRKVQQIMDERFDYVVSDDPETPAPIGDYRPDDSQEFIR
jgi:formate dehydrogenase (coenzyme F420) beta subunit